MATKKANGRRLFFAGHFSLRDPRDLAARARRCDNAIRIRNNAEAETFGATDASEDLKIRHDVSLFVAGVA